MVFVTCSLLRDNCPSPPPSAGQRWSRMGGGGGGVKLRGVMPLSVTTSDFVAVQMRCSAPVCSCWSDSITLYATASTTELQDAFSDVCHVLLLLPVRNIEKLNRNNLINKNYRILDFVNITIVLPNTWCCVISFGDQWIINSLWITNEIVKSTAQAPAEDKGSMWNMLASLGSTVNF